MKLREIALASLLLALSGKSYAVQNTLGQDTMKLEEKVMSEKTKVEEQVLSETGLQQKDEENTIWQEYLEGKRKKPSRFQLKGASHPYFCTAFVQERLVEVYGIDFCKKAGIIGDGKRIGGTWNLLDNLENNGYVIWEKEEKSSETYKKLKKEGKLKYADRIKKLKETNTKEAENIIQQGDILFSWYPQSLFKQKYVTHTYIVLGKKDNNWYILQEWGTAVEIMKLDKLYNRVPGGIDAVVRLSE